MSQPPILILSAQATAYAAELAPQLEQPLWPVTRVPDRRRLERIAVMLADPDLAARAVAHMPALRWLQSTWAGVTPLLKLPLQHYRLTNIKGVFGPLMSEYVFAHLLAHERQLLAHYAANQRREWYPRRPGGLRGKTLGLLGVGSIGRHLAGTAAHFGLRVLGYSRSRTPLATLAQHYGPGELLPMLGQCDYLVASLPSTPQTRNLLDAAALAATKPGAVLINVGRGNLLDEGALIDALARGQLAAAVLDVLRQEPLPGDHPFWRTPNLHITSHTAAPSLVADIAPIFCANFHRYRRGEALQFEVDFQRGY